MAEWERAEAEWERDREAKEAAFAQEQEAQEELGKRLRELRLNVARACDAVELSRRDADYRYLKAEFGLNMIVPKGKVTELRFHVDLCPDGVLSDGPPPAVALDGFPHSDVAETALLAGSVRLSVSSALKLLPVPADVLPVDVELAPWEFRFGAGRKVHIQFGGGLTAEPEWYATEAALAGEFRVATLIRSPLARDRIDAGIQAYLRYDPGLWQRADVFTDAARIEVATFSEEARDVSRRDTHIYAEDDFQSRPADSD